MRTPGVPMALNIPASRKAAASSQIGSMGGVSGHPGQQRDRGQDHQRRRDAMDAERPPG